MPNLHTFAISLLAAIIGVAVLTASDGARPAQDGKKKPPGEDKNERPLADLEKRCIKMLEMQTDLYDETKKLHTAIESNKDKKPGAKDKAAALQLAEKQKAAIVEATKAIDILKKEGAAAAFPEVFEEVRKDMTNVQIRLEKIDAGKATQEIQVDLMDTLGEMIKALKKT